MSQDTPTVETQVNESSEATVNNEDTTVQAEPTVADLHKEVIPDKKKIDSVPLARLNKEIEKRKALEEKLAEYEGNQADYDEPDSDSEVSKLAQKLEQIEQRENRAQLESTFMQHLNKALDNAPEYKDIVNVDVIKALAFNPANANKTYSQLLNEAYGNAVTGRRTIETTTPRGGAKDDKVDMNRARTDGEYRREVLLNPELKKQYNEGLTDRVFR